MSSKGSPPPDGNQNRTGQALYMTIVPTIIGCVFVVLRMYTRLLITKSARWDDWTICMAALGTIVGAALDSPEIHYGYGRHQYYLTHYQLQEYQKYNYGEWIQSFFTLMITKVSICLLFLRISPYQRIIWPIRGVIAFSVLTTVILTFLYIFQCIPVDAAWDTSKKKTAKCLSDSQVRKLIISPHVTSMIPDFVLATFPIIILYTVQIRLRQKILLCALMGLGVLTGVCCVARAVLNWYDVHPDQTWVGMDDFLWRTVEVNLGIVCACIPTLLPLFRLMRAKVKNWISRQDSKSKSSVVSKLKRGLGPKIDQWGDQEYLVPHLEGKKEGSDEKNGAFMPPDLSTEPIAYPEQLRTADGVGRRIMVETDLRVESRV